MATRRHRHLTISSQLLRDYRTEIGPNAQGKILLVLREVPGPGATVDVVLEFFGFHANGEVAIQRLLDPVPNTPPRPINNIILGYFKKDQNDIPLFDVLMTEPFEDIYLTPDRYFLPGQPQDPGRELYVKYDLEGLQGFAPTSMHPSPPAD